MAAGRADLVEVTYGRYGSLALRYPTRVHPGLRSTTVFLFLNTRQPPFNNFKARQAVNYAIDRGRLIRLHLSSPAEATPTCQILPAGFPGHQPYCPYAADGVGNGPDLVKAARLAHQSGTTNVPVTVWIDRDGLTNDDVNAYLWGLFTKLGYRTTLRVLPDDQFSVAAGDSARKVQAGLGGWAPDIPTASDFFLLSLSCSSVDQHPGHTDNFAEFCDPMPTNWPATRRRPSRPIRPPPASCGSRSTTSSPTRHPGSDPQLGESVFVSARTGNYQNSQYYGGPLLDQMWVR